MQRIAIALLFWLTCLPSLADDALWERLREGGYVLLMRHAQTVPGVGDPAGFSLDDCATQRNLSESGRAQARRTGEAFRKQGIVLAEVRSSAWCRCVDTGELAFGRATVWPALNSFFQASSGKERQTAEVLAAMTSVKAPQNWMLVTHQVNITALTGEWPSSGEILVVKAPPASGKPLTVVGKLNIP